MGSRPPTLALASREVRRKPRRMAWRNLVQGTGGAIAQTVPARCIEPRSTKVGETPPITGDSGLVPIHRGGSVGRVAPHLRQTSI